jgi:hypothetical protein
VLIPRCYPSIGSFGQERGLFRQNFRAFAPEARSRFEETKGCGAEGCGDIHTGGKYSCVVGYLASKYRFLNRLWVPSEMSPRTGANVLSPKLILSTASDSPDRWE